MRVTVGGLAAAFLTTDAALLSTSTTPPSQVAAQPTTPAGVDLLAAATVLPEPDRAVYENSCPSDGGCWQITGNAWIAILLAAIKGFSWILTALLLAGVTGLLRKG